MTDVQANVIRDVLFDLRDTFVYAVLDGARVGEDLLPKLTEGDVEHACLYRGELAPDLAACAPYLVRIEKSGDFLAWLLKSGWGKDWGIFLASGADMALMRRHLRRFLIVASPEGKRLYFRYYDPRVLRVYLPTCSPVEARHVFGPIQQYLVEGPEAKPGVCVFRRCAAGVEETHPMLGEDARLVDR